MSLAPDLSKPLLAIDTSTPICSIALRVNGEVYAQNKHEHNRHTAVILPMLDAILAKADVRRSDVAGIIVGAGPGAFTGLRVGAAVASGFANAIGCPLGLISSLALLAATSDVCGCILSVLDARMGQLYAGLYQRSKTNLISLENEILISPEQFDTNWLSRAEIIVGPGASYLSNAKKQCYPSILPYVQSVFSYLPNVIWQCANTPVELNYLREQVTS